MNKNEKIVEPLKKVTLSVTPEIAPDGSNPSASAQTVEFVFGVGSRGLSPFEYELAGMRPGETRHISVDRGKAGEFFDHLHPVFCSLVPHHVSSRLHVGIIDIADADHREMIRAMAGSAACGGDCACGCGGH